MPHEEARDQLVNWLNDAVGMEESLVQVLTNHAKDAKDYPHVRQIIEDHIEVTKNHAEMVRNRIDQIGASPSGMKSTMGKVQGWFTGMSTGAAGDELVKNALAEYSSEHFEIACYSALIEASHFLGDTQTAQMCERIRQDEFDQAERLVKLLPSVVTDYMSTKERKAA